MDLCWQIQVQPDLVLVSWSLKRVALVQPELSSPIDVSSELLAAAHAWKLCTYGSLMEELLPYLDRGPDGNLK
jgi:hypothetical protein